MYALRLFSCKSKSSSRMRSWSSASGHDGSLFAVKKLVIRSACRAAIARRRRRQNNENPSRRIWCCQACVDLKPPAPACKLKQAQSSSPFFIRSISSIEHSPNDSAHSRARLISKEMSSPKVAALRTFEGGVVEMAARPERETKPAAGEVPTRKAMATDENVRRAMIICLLRMVGTKEEGIILCEEARSSGFSAPPKDRERCHARRGEV